MDMPSPLRDPKSLPEWIELDYYRRPRPLRRLRAFLTWGVFFLSLTALAATLATQRMRFYQPGPLATAHAMFTDNCGQCHTESFQPVKRFFHGDHHIRPVTADACARCHPA